MVIGTDTSGLSRWSYIELQGRDDKCFIILSGYRVCENQTIDFGSNNTFNQQYRILHQQGHQNPDPRTQFFSDLTHLIKSWREQTKAVLICLNANGSILPHKLAPSIKQLFQDTNLIDLHALHHQPDPRPPTYNQGTKTIDICAGSPNFLKL